MTGDQPTGTMTHSINKNLHCSGYNVGTIIISYSFPSGMRNGKHYSGTHRTAYLPDTKEGKEVL
jgi:deltex